MIKEFQEKYGLKPDGILGPKTAEKMREEWGILTNEHLAHFLAQCHHESGGFKATSENLNYSKEGLLKIFPKYFTSALALSYARNPEKIANRVYANRLGNGIEASGDGYRFRGRGFIQLTGKDNYLAFSKWINDSKIMDNPSLVAEKYAIESALFFFKKNKIFSMCDFINDTSIKYVTKAINGGANGLMDRIKLTVEYLDKLK